MGPTIKLVLFLLFVAVVVSGLYLQHCINVYRDSVPKPRVVGPLTAIRASLRWMHDPNDPTVSEEVLIAVRRMKTAAFVAGTIWTIVATVVIVGAALDFARFLDCDSVTR